MDNHSAPFDDVIDPVFLYFNWDSVIILSGTEKRKDLLKYENTTS